jgi:hypothetical protein
MFAFVLVPVYVCLSRQFVQGVDDDEGLNDFPNPEEEVSRRVTCALHCSKLFSTLFIFWRVFFVLFFE